MKRQVLDHGYVLTLDTLGSDLTVVTGVLLVVAFFVTELFLVVVETILNYI